MSHLHARIEAYRILANDARRHAREEKDYFLCAAFADIARQWEQFADVLERELERCTPIVERDTR
jgi:hypothetical protein